MCGGFAVASFFPSLATYRSTQAPHTNFLRDFQNYHTVAEHAT